MSRYDAVAPERARRSRGPILFGISIIVIWIAGFVIWAFRAPIDGAVVTQGSFFATGQNKLVQHLEGGILREMRVKEGDMVKEGQVVARLDETAANARLRRLTQRLKRMTATQARLHAEIEAKSSQTAPMKLVKLFAALTASFCLHYSFAQTKNYATLVNPFIGTGGHGHTYPGASMPFGMMQLSPDTMLEGWDGCGGYHYSDSLIYGFSHTHLSGTGIPDYCDILLMPFTVEVKWKNKEYASPFSHKNEKAHAGYYECCWISTI